MIQQTTSTADPISDMSYEVGHYKVRFTNKIKIILAPVLRRGRDARDELSERYKKRAAKRHGRVEYLKTKR